MREEQPGGKKKQASPELTQEVGTTVFSLNRVRIQTYQYEKVSTWDENKSGIIYSIPWRLHYRPRDLLEEFSNSNLFA